MNLNRKAGTGQWTSCDANSVCHQYSVFQIGRENRNIIERRGNLGHFEVRFLAFARERVAYRETDSSPKFSLRTARKSTE